MLTRGDDGDGLQRLPGGVKFNIGIGIVSGYGTALGDGGADHGITIEGCKGGRVRARSGNVAEENPVGGCYTNDLDISTL